MNKEQWNNIRALLSAPKRIVLTAHTNPDGDAIGSLLALYFFLVDNGHRVTMVVPNQFPSFYSWLPGSGDIIIYEQQARKVQRSLKEAELVFSLDYNALNRVGPLSEFIAASPAQKVLIDHHIDPEETSFNFIHWDTASCSTGELVYTFIEQLGKVDMLRYESALALYTCIVTDTGSFSYASNRAQPYQITAQLIELGVDAEKVHRLIYDTFSETRLRLLGFAISERMEVWDDLHTAIIYLTKTDLNRFNYQVGDTEGLVNYPLMMEKINVSVLITEKDNKLRLSFRSKGEFSVDQVARKFFNGGGHRNAAGGNAATSVNELIERLKTVMQQYRKDLDYTIQLDK